MKSDRRVDSLKTGIIHIFQSKSFSIDSIRFKSNRLKLNPFIPIENWLKYLKSIRMHSNPSKSSRFYLCRSCHLLTFLFGNFGFVLCCQVFVFNSSLRLCLNFQCFFFIFSSIPRCSSIFSFSISKYTWTCIFLSILQCNMNSIESRKQAEPTETHDQQAASLMQYICCYCCSSLMPQFYFRRNITGWGMGGGCDRHVRAVVLTVLIILLVARKDARCTQ